MMTKTNDGWHLYVWWNGQLIYKRWLQKGYGCIVEEYGPVTFSPPRKDFVNRLERELGRKIK